MKIFIFLKEIILSILGKRQVSMWDIKQKMDFDKDNFNYSLWKDAGCPSVGSDTEKNLPYI